MHFKLLLGVWLRLLYENGSQIAPRNLGRAAAITLSSFSCSLLNSIQKLAYGAAVADVALPASPIFILGHWRSGTTLLHELLCLDTRHSFANTYACMNPAHFLITEEATRASKAWKSSAKRPMDGMTITLSSPQEDEFALFALGAPSPYVHWMFPGNLSTHREYFDVDTMPATERNRWKTTFGTFLRSILLRSPGRPVIKSPPHTFRVTMLQEMFPEAVFVHIVRDPYVLFASTRHLLSKMFEIYALTPYRIEDIEEYILRNGESMERQLDAAIPKLGRDRYHRIRYEDLVARPIDLLGTLYEKLSLGDIRSALPAMRAHLDGVSAYQTNRFTLSPDEKRRISERWRKMFLKYGYALDGQESPGL